MQININFSAVGIAALVGTILTVFFAYFPKVRVWFASLEVEKQSLIRLGLMVVVTLGLYGISFLYPPPYDMGTLLGVILALIVTNQPVAALLPTTKDVRAAIVARVKRFGL